MNKIEFKLAIKDKRFYEDIFEILRDTNDDFIPPITHKNTLEEVVNKYVEFGHVYISYVNHLPAGFVAFYPNVKPKESYLSLIGVKSDYRGFEIGKNLELKCIDFCKQANSKGIILNMRKSNIKLLESRLRLGYKIISEYKLPYSNELIVDMYLEF